MAADITFSFTNHYEILLTLRLLCLSKNPLSPFPLLCEFHMRFSLQGIAYSQCIESTQVVRPKS